MSPLYSRRAVKSLDRMDEFTQRRMRQGINKLPAGDVKKLKGYVDTFRLRIGDYRIIFDMVPGEIRINDILLRGEAYKGV